MFVKTCRMFIKIIPSLIFIALFTSPLPATDIGQEEEEHKPIVEKVDVVNVEIPVRVLYKNKPVTGLTIDDFTIYENKKKVEINGFFVKRKTIDVPKTQSIKTGQSVADIPRAFVLVFSITDFNPYLVKAVDHLFDNVLKPNDRLMVFANDHTITHPNVRDKNVIKKQLLAHLRRESKVARRRLLKYINSVENELRINDFRRQIHKRDARPRRLLEYLKKYLLIWNDYKSKYLTPRVDRFYYFSRYLENMKAEKWVLSFYQFDLFPKIRLGSETMDIIRNMATRMVNSPNEALMAIGRLIFTLMTQMTLDFNVYRGMPIKEISKLFYKVDATFHSFFIRTLRSPGGGDFEYTEVASNIENTLKAISDATGGKNITSNNLVKSINTISTIEDSYYLLTYVPTTTDKNLKLKIRVKNKKYDVRYDNNFRSDYISSYLEKLEKNIKLPEVKIKGFSFKKKILVFTVSDYLMKENKEKKEDNVNMRARLRVRIRLSDHERKNLFDQANMLTGQKNETHITLNAFRNIKKGEYLFTIDAHDLYTGKKTNLHRTVSVKK